MERCTIRLKTGEARCAQLDGNVVVERLAAYEDTGLTPEEITARRWVPAAEPPKEWKDEKTGYMKNYLINCVDSGVDVGSYHALAGCWLCCGLPVTVTHWMPLPEAPGKEAWKNG